MLILAVDTSGRNGSIALVRFVAETPDTLEVAALAGGTFSAQLVPQISELLKTYSLTKSDIDGFVVASGPGSFTGLRVGLAAVKALAEILEKPIAAVSLLEAVACAAGIGGEVVAALDAGRGEIYFGKFRVVGSRATMTSQQLLTAPEFLACGVGQEIVTPDQRIANLSRENNLRVTQIDSPRADTIARLGFMKIQAGEIISTETLDANYIRRSDAEIKKSINHQ